jgi:hypothetical protein
MLRVSESVAYFYPIKQFNHIQTHTAEETGANPIQLLGPGGPEWGPEPDSVAFVPLVSLFIVSRN